MQVVFDSLIYKKKKNELYFLKYLVLVRRDTELWFKFPDSEINICTM